MSENTPTGASGATEEPDNAVETAGGLTVDELRDWLRQWVADATGQPVEQIPVERPMEELGLSSRDAVALAADVEDRTGVILNATAVYNHPTIASLATRIIELSADGVVDFSGTYDDYLRSQGVVV